LSKNTKKELRADKGMHADGMVMLQAHFLRKEGQYALKNSDKL